MRKYLFVAFIAWALCSCAVTAPQPISNDPTTPEEAGLDLRCLTDDDVSVVSATNGNRRFLALSPDGTQLVHISRIDSRNVAVTRKISHPQVGTQRTFRDTYTVSWGADGNIYFGDDSYSSHRPICSVSASAGTLMRQHTNGGVDVNPILSRNKKRLFFTRYNNSAPSIWCYDLTTSSLSLCCGGATPYPIDSAGKTILCVRDGAIWIVDYEQGQESLLCGSKSVTYSNPSISPDGEWILFEGSRSDGYSAQLSDLYVVRKNGTDLTQITFHTAKDSNPVWSHDGKRIYFISGRGNTKQKNNIWSMAFPYAK